MRGHFFWTSHSPLLSAQAAKPKKRRAPPTDLSGMTAEEIVARRNRLAREYSLGSRQRRFLAKAMLERDTAALCFARDLIEYSPGIAYLILSADMRGLILYANGGAERMFGVSPDALLGRCVGHGRVV